MLSKYIYKDRKTMIKNPQIKLKNVANSCFESTVKIRHQCKTQRTRKSKSDLTDEECR